MNNRYHVFVKGTNEIMVKTDSEWYIINFLSRHPGKYTVHDTQNDSYRDIWTRPDLPEFAFGVGYEYHKIKSPMYVRESKRSVIAKEQTPSIFNGYTQGW